jgi:hypothetical protein
MQYNATLPPPKKKKLELAKKIYALYQTLHNI